MNNYGSSMIISCQDAKLLDWMPKTKSTHLLKWLKHQWSKHLLRQIYDKKRKKKKWNKRQNQHVACSISKWDFDGQCIDLYIKQIHSWTQDSFRFVLTWQNQSERDLDLPDSWWSFERDLMSSRQQPRRARTLFTLCALHMAVIYLFAH